MNGWTHEFDKLKARINELITENEALKQENRELRADRDYWRLLIDQTGGKG